MAIKASIRSRYELVEKRLANSQFALSPWTGLVSLKFLERTFNQVYYTPIWGEISVIVHRFHLIKEMRNKINTRTWVGPIIFCRGILVV